LLPIFVLFWIVLNGKVTGEIIALGIVISLLVFLFACRYLGYSVKKDLRFLRKFPVLLWYLGNLILEVMKATFNVMKFVFSFKYEVEPVLIHFSVDFRTNIGRVMMANYITLTPGTITVDVDGNDFTVHCLDKDFSQGIDECLMVKIIKKMEE
jgi:multicomponent Na+:H+ antiporter subunit E